MPNNQEFLKQKERLKYVTKESAAKKGLDADKMIQRLMSDKNTFKSDKSMKSEEPKVTSPLPAWLDAKNGQVPPVYEAIWNKVRASPSSDLCDSELVTKLFSTSGLSLETMSYIWAVGELKSRSHMTQQELYIMLVLIALYQEGTYMSDIRALKSVEKVVVPKLDYMTITKGENIVPDAKTLWKTHFAKNRTAEDGAGSTKPADQYEDFDAVSLNFLGIIDKNSDLYMPSMRPVIKVKKTNAHRRRVRSILNKMRYKLPPITETVFGSMMSLDEEELCETKAEESKKTKDSNPAGSIYADEIDFIDDSDNSDSIQTTRSVPTSKRDVNSGMRELHIGTQKLTEVLNTTEQDFENLSDDEFTEFQSAPVFSDDEFSEFQSAVSTSSDSTHNISSISDSFITGESATKAKINDILELDPLKSNLPASIHDSADPRNVAKPSSTAAKDTEVSQELYRSDISTLDFDSPKLGKMSSVESKISDSVSKKCNGSVVKDKTSLTITSKEPRSESGKLNAADNDSFAGTDIGDKYNALRWLELDILKDPSAGKASSSDKTEDEEFGDFVTADQPINVTVQSAKTEQVKCMETCAFLLEQGISHLEELKSEEMKKEFFSDERGSRYFRQLKIAYDTSQRFRKHFGNEVINARLDSAWEKIITYEKYFTEKTSETSELANDNVVLGTCNLCKTECTSDNSAKVNGQVYHVTCANLFLNFVEGANIEMVLGSGNK